MKKIMLAKSIRALTLLALASSILACSSASNNLRDVASRQHAQALADISVAINTKAMQAHAQEDGELLSLHASREQVGLMAQQLLSYYGFEQATLSNGDSSSAQQTADFSLVIDKVQPLSKNCVAGVADEAELDASYTLSVLTLGVFPATKVYCVLVEATLYDMRAGEAFEMGQFFSKAGQLEAYASVQTLTSYRRSVSAQEEGKAIEVSLASVLNELIDEGAFSY